MTTQSPNASPILVTGAAGAFCSCAPATLLTSRRAEAISISCAFMLGLLRRASVRRTARIARSSSFNSGPEEELPPPALSFFSAHTDLQPEARLYSSLARKADALSPKFTVLPGCVTQRIS